MGKRSLYTDEDDCKMIEYLSEKIKTHDPDANKPCGHAIWRKAYRSKVTRHSAQSMQSRFSRVLSKRLGLLNCDEAKQRHIARFYQYEYKVNPINKYGVFDEEDSDGDDISDNIQDISVVVREKVVESSQSDESPQNLRSSPRKQVLSMSPLLTPTPLARPRRMIDQPAFLDSTASILANSTPVDSVFENIFGSASSAQENILQEAPEIAEIETQTTPSPVKRSAQTSPIVSPLRPLQFAMTEEEEDEYLLAAGSWFPDNLFSVASSMGWCSRVCVICDNGEVPTDKDQAIEFWKQQTDQYGDIILTDNFNDTVSVSFLD